MATFFGMPEDILHAEKMVRSWRAGRTIRDDAHKHPNTNCKWHSWDHRYSFADTDCSCTRPVQMFEEIRIKVLDIIQSEKRLPTVAEWRMVYEPEASDPWDSLFEQSTGWLPITDPIPSWETSEPMWCDEWADTTWKDFAKTDEAKETALGSTLGVTKHNINHPLI